VIAARWRGAGKPGHLPQQHDFERFKRI